MKKAGKSKFISTIAAVVAVAMAGTAILSHSVSVQAAARFPGVDILIDQNSPDKPFKVLEVVEDKAQASLGFYFKGNEPFGIDKDGHAMDFDEVLATFKSPEARQQYVESLKTRLAGNFSVYGVTSGYPVLYEEYQEKYFMSEKDNVKDWKVVALDEYQIASIPGEYVEAAGGDYVKNKEQYTVATDGTGDYVENIEGFTVWGENKAYNVTFTKEVKNTHLGLYLPVYEAYKTVENEADLPKTGTYWIRTASGEYTEVNMEDCAFGSTEDESKTVIADGTVLYTFAHYEYDRAEAAEGEDTSKYYYVDAYEFAYDATTSTYTGGYAASIKHGEGDAPYLKVEAGKGTHKMEENTYSYLPGLGNYNFVPADETDTEAEICKVEVASYYYQGGFESDNWFRKMVFTLNAQSIEANLLAVSLRTVTPDELTPDSFEDVDLVVFSGTSGANASGVYGTDSMKAEVVNALYNTVNASKLPCIINSEIMQVAEDYAVGDSAFYDHMRYYFALREGTYDSDNNFVNGCIYWHTGDILNKDFASIFETEAQKLGFEEIVAYAEEENKYLALEGASEDELISTDLSQAVAVQYILSRQTARDITQKQSLTILEIEPCADYYFVDTTTFTKYDKVRVLTGYSKEDMPNNKITIEQMTTAEFIGKIEDLNGKYDFIYIGMQTGKMNLDESGATVYNDSSMNGYVYTHTGDAILGTERLMGMLDTDYVANDRINNYPYSRDVYKLRTRMQDGKLVLNPTTLLFDVTNRNNQTQQQMVTVGSVGAYRYAGNDITETKMLELGEYLEAGYPVILANDFFAIDATGNRVINEKKLDNSSYLYEFVKKYVDMKQANLFRQGDIVSTNTENATQEDFNFYLTIPKLKINFNIDGGMCPPNVLEDQYVQIAADNHHYLEYSFVVEDEAAASPANTKYTVAVYIDINADGKFSRVSEVMSDIKVIDEETGLTANSDELVAGRRYTVTRQIPDGFRSVVPWQIEVSQTENPLIRKSETGFAGVKITGTKEVIKVLQICPNGTNTWAIASDNEFKDLMKKVEDFAIDVTSITVNEYQSRAEHEKYLEGFDMLVIGFADVYGNFTNLDAINGILSYINSGKSVLFTHDTTSFVNFDGKTADNIDADNGQTMTMDGSRWGYLFNTYVRNAVGMDRYGVSSSEAIGQILKEGRILDENTEAFETVENAEKDMAYVVGSNRTQTYPEVQGYTYVTLNASAKALAESKNEKYANVSKEQKILEVITKDAATDHGTDKTLDQDTTTYWQSASKMDEEKIYPYIGLKLNSKQESGKDYTFIYEPRTGNSQNGRLKKGSIEVSQDGATWTAQAEIAGNNNGNQVRVQFKATTDFNYIRLRFETSYGNPENRYASAKRIALYSGKRDSNVDLARNSTGRCAVDSAITNTEGEGNQEKASNVIRYQGGSNEIWHSAYNTRGTYESGVMPDRTFPWSTYKYDIVIRLEAKQSKGSGSLTYLPRQDSANGRITSGKLYLSNDGERWTHEETFVWANNAVQKSVSYDADSDYQYIKLEVTGTASETNAGQNTYVSAAEFSVTTASMSDDNLIGTYSQYYNLDAEKTNVAVMKANGNGAYSNSKVTAVNKGQVTSYPFQIEDEFIVSMTHAQYYQLDLEADKDNDGEKDIVVWYCISDAGSDNPYKDSPNDVRNNYYIYSIGNVFYSGVGHSTVSSTEEKKLFINTMVAAYSAKLGNPTVTSLLEEDTNAEEADSVYLPVEYSLPTGGDFVGGETSASSYLKDNSVEFHYAVYDANFVNGSLGSNNQKTITVKYYLASTAADAITLGNGAKVVDITSQVTTTKNDTNVGTTVNSGNAYTAKWEPGTSFKELLDGKTKLEVYIEVSSSFDYYGKEKTLYGYDTIYVKETNLFNLD